MASTRLHIGRRALLGAAAAALVPFAHAQGFPSRTVTIVVPFGPGNAYDQMARYLADRLREELGQPVIIEARQGALGGVAASYVARAQPDGHTLLFGANSTHAANVHLFKKIPYDPVADFAPITTLATIPQVLVVSPSLGVNNLQELVALARKEPGKLNYGSSSATGRVASEAFRQMAGIDAVHVPYKTSAQAITDLVGGQLHFLVTDAGLGVTQWRGGKVKALGVSSAQRVPAIADLPTMAEAGLPGYEFTAWLALFAPARTPAPVVSRLSETVNKVVRSPGMQEYLAKMYALPFPGSPESLKALVDKDSARWGQLIKAAGIEPE
ncbi:tripartite tricarboxylate transporter substrate binding protein [Ramlibacter sp. AW1]|uniref:Tripartite tricarboxylate transporter substrate binding protein n=1 Tax=Ramlibacter aurantiacus TaxID=2801330 RepID=A0A936ZVT7_9BURK|nr:tripartite tricarboxylate transporter substrate binding protein [Ramlibacter aurantiacus]MBL0421484.1 tripartite tricarboxylate transporter substrate binding protein [Ramlibacter aurantiacus]